MNYKLYYYEEKDMCIISEFLGKKPNIDTLLNNQSVLKISLKEKNVENIFGFFKENTIKQLLSETPKIIKIDYSEISGLPLYTEVSFQKLIELINSSASKCNEAINQYISSVAIENNSIASNEQAD